MPAVEEHLTDEETKEICQELLNTIKIPRNMSLLKNKLPASKYENDKVEEDEEENYEDDFERDKSETKQRKKEIKEEIRLKKKDKTRDKSERVRRRPKGLPPTAPAQQMIVPQTNRNQNLEDIRAHREEILNRNIQSRKGQRAHRVNNIEGARKKRRNPKTTESHIAESKQPSYQVYRMYSREKKDNPIEGKR